MTSEKKKRVITKLERGDSTGNSGANGASSHLLSAPYHSHTHFKELSRILSRCQLAMGEVFGAIGKACLSGNKVCHLRRHVPGGH